MKGTLPNFLIIGAEKAGTTALYHYLRQHPEVYMSPLKEINFFSFEGEEPEERGPGHKPTEHVTDIEGYRALFEQASDEKAIGEASTSYIWIPKASERIRHYVPDARLIAVLRNPIDRAYSNFLHSRWLGREPLDDFGQALQEEEERARKGWGGLWRYKQKGFYYDQLKRYFDTFERDQIKVYLHEDLNSEPAGMLRDIFHFLGVEESFAPDVTAKLNVSGVPRHRTLHALVTRLNRPAVKKFFPAGMLSRLREPVRRRILAQPPELTSEAREELAELYRKDILKLQNLIHRDLSGWLE